jgi:hypothetical protein
MQASPHQVSCLIKTLYSTTFSWKLNFLFKLQQYILHINISLIKKELHTQGFKGNTTFYGTCRLEKKYGKYNKIYLFCITDKEKERKKKKRNTNIFFYVYLFSQILKVNVDLTFSSNTGLLFTLKII